MGEIRVSNKVTVTPISDVLKSWATQNLILDNPQYLRKQRMGIYTGRTPRKLYLYETNGDSMILPFGLLKHVLAVCPSYDIKSDFADPVTVDFGSEPIPLYDYQQEAVEHCVEEKFGILQSAPGSGKTQMGLAIIQKFGRKALWLTHTKDLLQQSKSRAEKYMDPSLMGTITGGKVSIGKGITFANIQTMACLDLSQYKDEWDVIICDECHRISGTPTRMSQYSKVLNTLSARHKYGLSATVHRADGLIEQTFSLLGYICHTVPQDAVQERVMKVAVKPVSTQVVQSREYLGSDGMMNYAKLISYLCENEERNILIARQILLNRGKSCLILSDRISHLETLQNMLPPDLRKDSVLISGQMVSKTAKEQRQQAIEDMRTGKKLYLFASYSLAKEGLDIPRLQRLFLVTPHKDSAVITQSVGRIARTFEGKEEPICYDIVDEYIRFLYNAWRKRVTIYKRAKCYFI